MNMTYNDDHISCSLLKWREIKREINSQMYKVLSEFDKNDE